MFQALFIIFLLDKIRKILAIELLRQYACKTLIANLAIKFDIDLSFMKTGNLNEVGKLPTKLLIRSEYQCRI